MSQKPGRRFQANLKEAGRPNPRQAGMTWLAVSLLLAVMAGAGCTTNTDPIYGPLDPALPYSRIMVNDDELGRALRFDEPIVIRDKDGFITQVEVTVRAAAVKALKVDYRPIFKSDRGIVLQPESSWRTEFLEARLPERIVMRPTGRNAMDYEIQFRWSR